MSKMSTTREAYAVVKGDRIFLDGTAFHKVTFIDENGVMGTRTFSFVDHSRVKVALGAELVIK